MADLSYGAFQNTTSPSGTGGKDLSYNAFTNTPAASAAKPTLKTLLPNLPAAQSNGSELAPMITSAFKGGVSQAKAGLAESDSAPPFSLQRLSGVLNAGAGAVTALSAPLAPILNPLSTAINEVGNVISNNKSLQKFATTPAGATAIKVARGVQNAAVVGGAAAGGVEALGEPKVKTLPVMDEPTEGVPNVRKIQELPVKGKSIETPVPIKAAYTPPDELPTIQLGPKPKEALPTIQTETPKPKTAGDITIEPIKAPVGPKITSTSSVLPKVGDNTLDLTEPPQTATEPLSSKDNIPSTRTSSTLKPIKGTGDMATRGVSKSIEASAIEKGLTDSFGDLPEYKKVNFTDQAAKVADLIAKDPDAARDIALGNKAAPQGVVPEMVAVGIERQALADNDVETLRELANSKLTTAGTTMGQRIAAYGQRDTASPSAAIKEVQDAREVALKDKSNNTTTESRKINNEIRKTNTKESWSSFVENITC